MVLLGQPGVADDQLAAVEDVVADEAADELPYLLDELLRLPLQLLDGLGEAVGPLDLGALQVTAELVLVVPGHAQGVAGLDHAHDAAQDAGAVGAAVDEVADEDGGAALGVDPVLVAELGEQGLQLGGTAVDVTDDVEGTGEMGEVVEPLLQDHLGGLGFLDGAQHVDLAEALALQTAQRAPQVAAVPLDDGAGQPGPVGAGGVALGADLLGHVQDDGDRQDVVLAGECDQLPAGVGLDAGRVDDGQAAGGEALARDVVQDVEGVAAGALVVLVVGDQAPAVVGGDGLGGLEVLAGEGGLARSGGPDQNDEGQVGDGKCARTGVSVLVMLPRPPSGCRWCGSCRGCRPGRSGGCCRCCRCRRCRRAG